MKKTAIVILALVLTLSLSLVVFVGCNKDKEENADIPSNSETLGTAVAVAASYYGADSDGEAAAAADEADDVIDVEAGINLTLEAPGINASFSSAASASVSGLSKMLEPGIEKGVNSVGCFVNDNSVTVAEVTSDDENYSNQYKITLSYIDDETAETVTKEYSLYVDVADGVDVDGTTSYTFDAKLVLSDTASFTFSGTATYDNTDKVMVFGLDLNLGSLATVTVNAQATSDGNIVVDLGANALGIAGASVKIELGKLDNGKYGAEITVAANVDVSAAAVEAIIKIDVVGQKNGESYKFDLSGTVDATLTLNLGVINGEFKAAGAVSGQAAYDATNDDFVLGLEGKLALTQVESEEAEA